MKPDFIEQCINYIFSIPREQVNPGYTKLIIESYLEKTYSGEVVQNFITFEFRTFLEEFVAEYNYKLLDNQPLCFLITDENGERIIPIPNATDSLQIVDAFTSLTPNEFEYFACNILIELGCSSVFLTPGSHDQGLDGFGYISCIVKNRVFESTLIFIQAKHYEDDICSINIREYVGSVELSKDKIWALLKDKYPQLNIKKYTPYRLIYLTSGHIKRTTKVLCEKAGIDILTRDDLVRMYPIFCTYELLKNRLEEIKEKIIKI